MNLLRLVVLSFVLLAIPSFAQEEPTPPSPPEDLPPTEPMIELDSMDRILEDGKLRVGISLYIPSAFHTPEGKLMGYEVDIARKVAKDMGVEAEFVLTSWDQALLDLRRNEFDVLISGLDITPGRALEVDFSRPYSTDGLELVASQKMFSEKQEAAGLNNPSMKLGVAKGSSGKLYLERFFPRAEHVEYESPQQALEALRDGEVSGLVTTKTNAHVLEAMAPEDVMVPLYDPIITSYQGMAVREGDNRLLDFLNAWIIYHEGDGWLAGKQSYWLRGIEWMPNLLVNEEASEEDQSAEEAGS